MEAKEAQRSEKRARYELLPTNGDSQAHSRSMSPLLNDMSEGEANMFEEAVVRKYSQLVGKSTAATSLPPRCRTVPPTIDELNTRYRRLLKVGEGSFGEVYLVYDTVTRTYLTMKRMLRLLHKGTSRSLVGVHNTTFREIQLLTTLCHPNVVEVVAHHVLADGSLIMFMPVVAHDFSSLVRHWSLVAAPSGTGTGGKSSRMPLPVVKCLFRQLLEGVSYLHRHKVVHRDLKPSNLMVGADGVLKIIDFGWARYIVADRGGNMTGPPCVVAYRAPEVLIGGTAARRYTFAIDVWCCGCILFEMLTGGTAFVSTRNEVEALSSIVDWLGSPAANSTVYVGRRGRVAELPAGRPSNFRSRCSAVYMAPAEIDFLSRMLVLEPAARSRAESLLLDDWFTTAPTACTPPDIPLPLTNTYRFVETRRGRRR